MKNCRFLPRLFLPVNSRHLQQECIRELECQARMSGDHVQRQVPCPAGMSGSHSRPTQSLRLNALSYTFPPDYTFIKVLWSSQGKVFVRFTGFYGFNGVKKRTSGSDDIKQTYIIENIHETNLIYVAYYQNHIQ